MEYYLITGGAGFIGSHLVDYLLSKKHYVVVVDNFNDYYDPKIKRENIIQHKNNPLFKLYNVDICDYDKMHEIFESFNFDVIVHLAARAGVRPSIENPFLYQDVNNRGTLIVYELARKFNANNIISASSSSVYGNNSSVPFKETDNVDYAISPYAATKKSNEVMGHVYHKLYSLNFIFLRFFTVYGPRQRPDLAIRKFTRLILEGKEIPFYGDGNTARDYTYIDDIIDGVIKAICFIKSNNKIYEIINLGEESYITLKELVDKLEFYLGKKAKINKMPLQSGDVYKTHASIDKARNLLGYQPQVDFDQGIKMFIDWYYKEV